MTGTGLLYLFIAVLSTASSQTLLKTQIELYQAKYSLKMIKMYFAKPLITFSFILNVIASVSWAKVIVTSNISIAIPIYTSLVFVANVLFGQFVFHEHIGRSKIIGGLCILSGISMILY